MFSSCFSVEEVQVVEISGMDEKQAGLCMLVCMGKRAAFQVADIS